MLSRLLFLDLVLWFWGPSMGLRHHTFWEAVGGYLLLRYPSTFSSTTPGPGSSHFCIFILLTIHNVASSVIIGYNILILLTFSWLIQADCYQIYWPIVFFYDGPAAGEVMELEDGWYKYREFLPSH